MRRTLEGVLVVDLSRVLAGPFCTMILADRGARVIKVEHPVEGDVTRGWGPPFDPRSGLSAYYLSVNRNKESLALDLATEGGARSVRILARRADVLVENFPPGGLEKFGLSLGALREENPRLVTASITGFGPSGPDAGALGFDLLAQAGAGLMSVTGDAGGPATKVGVAVSDLFAGSFAAAGILAALLRRERTGEGGHVETDLFSATAAALVNIAQSSLMTGSEPTRHGNAHPQIVPYRVFSASDGEFVLAVGTDRQFERLCELVGRPGWSRDPDFRSNEARVRNRGRLESELEALLRGQPRATWLARLREARIPSGAVRGVLEALGSATAEALGCVVLAEGVSFVASPIRITGEASPLRFPPALDGDGPRIRSEFGLPSSVGKASGR